MRPNLSKCDLGDKETLLSFLNISPTISFIIIPVTYLHYYAPLTPMFYIYIQTTYIYMSLYYCYPCFQSPSRIS
ncbi:hypothetical protein L6452_19326 [Arctium lappa]|uniref:Uncharacterized protein n=1 Tax=Arctium lappa TaxID=4217 RepID=A0ACB9B7J2_ARCLA|nr:hypothetical protein L6452_19326 [Arctium lappa]